MSALKKVALYSAEHKRNIVKSLKKSNFENEEEMMKYVRKLQEENRYKNKMFKQMTIKGSIMDKIEKQNIEIIDDQDPYNIKFDDDILLNLDKNTGSSILIIGRSKGGKSTCAMRIYENHYKDNKEFICTLFSGNPHIDVYKKDKNLLVTEGFTDAAASYCKMAKYCNTHTKNRYNFLMMFDDIIDKKRSPVIAEMYLTWRNARISIISCSQYSMNIAKSNRSNANYTIVFGASLEDEKNYIDIILKNYFIDMGVCDYREQLKLFRYVTNNYGFFIIENLKNKISFCRLKI